MVLFIREQSARPLRCPQPVADRLRTEILGLPETEIFVIDGDTVAQFESCEHEESHLVAPVMVIHLPTESMVGINPVFTGFIQVRVGTPSGQDRLARVVADSSLVAQLEALAPRKARC